MVKANVKTYYSRPQTASQKFGAPRDGGRRKHRGVDYSSSRTPGTPVPALLTGKIVSKTYTGRTGFGHHIVQEVTWNGRKYRLSYSHAHTTPAPRVGAVVKQGATISTEGTTGSVTGSCVHIECYDVSAGRFIDPITLIRAVIATPAGGGTSPSKPTYRPGQITVNRTVKWVQERLIAHGFSVGKWGADGVMGAATISAIRSFQRSANLEADGIVGPATEKALATPVQGKKAPAFPLKKGQYFGPRLPLWNLKSVSGYFSHRADLKRWQQRMKDRGWRITVDGLYGPNTASVARAFQREKGLVVDSLIGPATWAAAWTAPIT